VGAVLVATAMIARGRHTQRTRYQPDPWAAPEWATAAISGAVVAAFVVAARIDPAGLHPSVNPLVWPTLPVLATAAVALGALPAWVTPVPPGLVVVTPAGGAGTDDPRAGAATPPRRGRRGADEVHEVAS